MAKTWLYRIGTKKTAAAGRSARSVQAAGGIASRSIWNQQVAVLDRDGIPREEEAAMLSAMGYSAVQLQLAWPAVMHADGTPNAEGIARCKRWIAALRQYGLTPIVSVYFWQRPLWIRRREGWVNVKSAAAFNRFASLLHELFGKEAVIRTVQGEPWSASARELRLLRTGPVNGSSSAIDRESAEWTHARASEQFAFQS